MKKIYSSSSSCCTELQEFNHTSTKNMFSAIMTAIESSRILYFLQLLLQVWLRESGLLSFLENICQSLVHEILGQVMQK